MGNWHWRYYYSGITRKLAKELEIYVCLRATTTSTLTFKPTSLAGAKRVLIYQWTASWERKGKNFWNSDLCRTAIPPFENSLFFFAPDFGIYAGLKTFLNLFCSPWGFDACTNRIPVHLQMPTFDANWKGQLGIFERPQDTDAEQQQGAKVHRTQFHRRCTQFGCIGFIAEQLVCIGVRCCGTRAFQITRTLFEWEQVQLSLQSPMAGSAFNRFQLQSSAWRGAQMLQ